MQVAFRPNPLSPFREEMRRRTRKKKKKSWSPDGSLLIIPNSMVDQRYSALLLPRNEWEKDQRRDNLLGHKAPVEVAVCHFFLAFLSPHIQAH